MDLLNLINNAKNDDDIINIFKIYDDEYIVDFVKRNTNKIDNNKYINYLKYIYCIITNDKSFKKKYNRIKKYHNLNKKLCYFLGFLYSDSLKFKYYYLRSLKYMFNNNLKIYHITYGINLPKEYYSHLLFKLKINLPKIKYYIFFILNNI